MEPWYGFAAAVIPPAVKALMRLDFQGQENVPPTGGCIVAVNHISYADPFVVALYVHEAGRRPRFLAKSSLFKVPFVKQVLSGARQIPVFRNTANAADALRFAEAAVERGECVLIYPEGTVTRDPSSWPMTPRTGVARLALTTGAPVVPVGNWGAQAVWPYRRRPDLLPRKLCRVHAGPPVDLSPWRGCPLTTETLREATAAVMRDVTDIVAKLRGEVPPDEPFDPRAVRP